MENYIKIQEYAKKELDIEITHKQLLLFNKYKELLLEWNEKINLTAITDEHDIIKKHFIDSLSCIKSGLFEKGQKIVDVGTGAGFPGIPLNIAEPDLEVTLLDSLNKRILFLNKIVKELDLKHIIAIHSRAEDLGRDKKYREAYDVAVSRAVANLSTLSEYCLPFVKKGGHFVSMKGPYVEEEIEESKNSLKLLGGEIIRCVNIKISDDINHNLIIIKKIKQCPSKYPRKSGTPTKKPL